VGVFYLCLHCLTSLSTIFKLYRGGHYPEKTTNLSQVTGKLFVIVIGTDCTCSCKSNFHTITTATEYMTILLCAGYIELINTGKHLTFQF
jgi:hypothetical protein